MKKNIFLLGLVLLVAVALTSSRPHAWSMRSADDEAAAIIRAFVGRPDLNVKGLTMIENLPGTAQRTFKTADDAIFTVDMQHRQVVVATLPVKGLTGQGVNRDQALQAAVAFSAARVTDFGQLTLIREQIADHGAAGQQYAFEWAEQVGSQHALGTRRVAVSVEAGSGAVVSFMQILGGPVTVNVEPKVTREQALAIAQRRFNAPVSSSEVKLDVWWRNNDRSQPQMLRWTVTLESDQPISPDAVGEQFIPKRGAFIIDAHSAEILEEMY